VAFRRADCPADSPPMYPLSAGVSIGESVDESVLLSAGPDSGHFNGLSAGCPADKGRCYIKSRELITWSNRYFNCKTPISIFSKLRYLLRKFSPTKALCKVCICNVQCQRAAN
jgi:hypothetical protein